MKLITGEISATNYKALCKKMQGMSKKELWKVLDHYLFHVISDEHAQELLKILNELEPKGVEAKAVPRERDDDAFEMPSPREKKTGVEPPREIRRGRLANAKIQDAPSNDQLEAMKHQLDLIYDFNYFDAYLAPEARKPTADALISFASANRLPLQTHWKQISQDPEHVFAPTPDDEEA